MNEHVERASARTGEFGRVAAAIDEAERIAGERIGGPTDAELGAIRRMERRLAELRPVTVADAIWVKSRLARALENGWHGRPAMMLLKLAGVSLPATVSS